MFSPDSRGLAGTKGPLSQGNFSSSSIDENNQDTQLVKHGGVGALLSLSNHDHPLIQLTRLTNRNGLLTKEYQLDQSGNLTKGTKAYLVDGFAEKISIQSLKQFSKLQNDLKPNECFAYGVTQHDVVDITIKSKLHEHPGKIARDRKHFQFRKGPAILMLDHDVDHNKSPLTHDELRDALIHACPALSNAPMLWTTSSSSHIFDNCTKKDLTGLCGQRIYILIKDGTDIPRAGKALYQRLWLNGHGRFDISTAGRLLDRSLIDESVWQPEREDFASGAACVTPLVQKRPSHIMWNENSSLFDSNQILELSGEERGIVEQTKNDARFAVNEERIGIREIYINEQSVKLAGECKIEVEQARQIVVDAIDRDILFADFILYPESGGTAAVAELLDNPEKWHGKRFFDPVEPNYRGDKRIAYANLRSGGHPYLYSHAHGGHRYLLQRQLPLMKLNPGEIPRLADECLCLIRLHGDLFDFVHRQLVRVADDRIYLVNPTWLADYLGRIALFQRFDVRSKEWRLTDVPERLAKVICERVGERTLPKLRAIVTAPTLRENGTVLDKPGFDVESGLLYLTSDMEPSRVPLKPDTNQVLDALRTLWHPFEKFPFADEVARGAMLSAILSVTIRRALPTCPGYIFDAPMMGSGKTLLARCVAALGGHVPELSVPPIEDQEARKSLFAALREGVGCIIWDNVIHPIDGAAINNFLTAPIFKDRILGVSENEALPNSAMFLATGNNVVVVGDTARRFVVCRIDAKVEQPYLREFNFDPLQWIIANRTELTIAALTVIRGYIAADRPRMVSGNTASFEAWDALVRQTVCWVDSLDPINSFADPMKTIEKSAAISPHKGLLLSILEAWYSYFGEAEYPSSQVFQILQGDFCDETKKAAYEALESALTGLNAGKYKEMTAHRLGQYLAKHEGEIVGGFVLCSQADTHRKVKLWCVMKLSEDML